MKKIVILLLVFLMISSVSAFSLEDFFGLRLDFSGKIVDNRNPSVTLSRPVNTQVVNNPVVFKFRYFDAEDDDMEFYILQIDDDPRFFSPQNYKGVGIETKVVLEEEGLYYWRVKVVNRFGESFSEIWEFYLNPKMKVCEDGTAYFECSLNKPEYCYAGSLKEDCQRCGCDKGGYCQPDGSCLFLECIDGTSYGECGIRKPLYCLNGKLEEVCNICGCDEGFECMGDGSCKEVIEEIEAPITGPPQGLTFLEKVALFFKRLFLGD